MMFSSFNLLLIKHSRYLCSGSKRKKSPTQKIYGNVEDPKRESIPSAWQSTAEVLVKRGKWQGQGFVNNFRSVEFLNDFDAENPIGIKGFPPSPSAEPVAASIAIRDFHVKNGGTYLFLCPISTKTQYRLGAEDPLNTQAPLFDPLTNSLCLVRYRVMNCRGSLPPVNNNDTYWTLKTADEFWVWRFRATTIWH